jgi:hypothetical protein
MDAELERYLDGLWASGREHDAELPDRTQRLRNVEPETARMLAVLVLVPIGAGTLLVTRAA